MSFYASSWFVSLLLGSIYVMLAAGVLLALWSVVHSVRLGRIRMGFSGWMALVALLITLLLTFLLASTEPIELNGKPYDNAFWLCVSDVLIDSSFILMLIAVAGVLFGMSGLSRKLKK